jgi:FkbM family methyltransferase
MGAGEVALYGTGALGVSLLRSAREAGLRVRHLVDGDPARWGRTLDGVEILPLGRALADGARTFCIATLDHAGPISEFIRRAGEAFGLEPVILTLERRQKALARAALEHLPEGGVVVDIGAHLGLFTRTLLDLRPCSAPVSAFVFEPMAAFHRDLKAAFRHDPTVRVERLALGDTAEDLPLWVDANGLPWTPEEGPGPPAGFHRIEVPRTTFDTYAASRNLDRVDVVRIDVDGAEARVLKGMRRTLAASRPVILRPLVPAPAGSPLHEEEAEAFEWLFAHGYRRCDYLSGPPRDLVLLPGGRA